MPPLGPALLYGRHLVRELMLASTLVLPEVLSGCGFQFAHLSVNEALVETIRGSAA